MIRKLASGKYQVRSRKLDGKQRFSEYSTLDRKRKISNGSLNYSRFNE